MDGFGLSGLRDGRREAPSPKKDRARAWSGAKVVIVLLLVAENIDIFSTL